MSDLPLLTGVIPAHATVDLLEAIGAGPGSEVIVPHIHLLGADVHSSAANLATYPMKPRVDGAPSYSYERWIRFRFSPPFGGIASLRFWVDNYSPNGDWEALYGVTANYLTPRVDYSHVATQVLPTSDPGETHPNMGIDILTGEEVVTTPWLVFQARRSGHTAAASLQTDPLNFQFAWVEA